MNVSAQSRQDACVNVRLIVILDLQPTLAKPTYTQNSIFVLVWATTIMKREKKKKPAFSWKLN